MAGMYRTPSRPPELPAPRTATDDRLAREFTDRPFGAQPGVFIVGGQPTVLEPLAPVSFPEPDWEEEERQAKLRDERRRREEARRLLEAEPLGVTEESSARPSQPPRRKELDTGRVLP